VTFLVGAGDRDAHGLYYARGSEQGEAQPPVLARAGPWGPDGGEPRAALSALTDAMRETGARLGTVVSLTNDEVVSTDEGEIRIVPARRWFLGPDRRRG